LQRAFDRFIWKDLCGDAGPFLAGVVFFLLTDRRGLLPSPADQPSHSGVLSPVPWRRFAAVCLFAAVFMVCGTPIRAHPSMAIWARPSMAIGNDCKKTLQSTHGTG
jgi:hypothetical protein